MDVVAKEGSLFLQGVKFGKICWCPQKSHNAKIWRKTWAILFEPSPIGIGRIEMYDMRDGGGVSSLKPAGLKKAEKRVVRLDDCLSITPAPGESCPSECIAFYLNTTQRTYTLAGPKQDEWVPTLCQLAFKRNEGSGESKRRQRDGDTSMSDNDLYSTWSPGQYRVTMQSSEASIRCCMSGSYLLSPEKEALCLLDMKTGQTAFYWPYRFLRRFGQIKDGITIEAGRRCQTGEGQFIFLSKQGTQIYRAIEEAIMHQSVQDLLSKATSQLQDPTPHQPPPRPVIDERMKGGQGSPTRSLQDRPALPRRNLALPPPPIPPAPTVPPAPPAPPAISTKPPVVPTKPPANTVKSPAVRAKHPVSTSGEVLYATIKPQPKPRVKGPPPKIPQFPPEPHYSPTHPRRTQDQEKEVKERPLSCPSDDPDSDYCNWKQMAEAKEDCPNTETVYSTVVPSARHKNKCGMEASQDPTNPSQHSHIISSPENPVNFKQMLSNVLFKDLTRTTPSFTPRSYGGSSDRLAKLDIEMDDLDYCEVKK
ncbi:hypothetical protein NFI96_001952 [Prochilodus magdalenae]|nr:hypothetical protein NFI96_001952 [Prochilodus magdalenae]